MLYILLAMLFYGIAIVLGSVASRDMNTNIVSAITNVLSAVIPTIIVLITVNKRIFDAPKTGILFAVLSGTAIALFSLALTKSYSMNKVAIVAPLVFGGAIFLSTILSGVFLKEKITLLQGIGLTFLGIGFLIIIFARIQGR